MRGQVQPWSGESEPAIFDDGPDGVRVIVGETALEPNTYIDPATGRVSRVVSSMRYKRDVMAASIDIDAVLALVPRTFAMKLDGDGDGDDEPEASDESEDSDETDAGDGDGGESKHAAEGARRYLGFIAEQAEELGLGFWVSYDTDGEPEAFRYGWWTVALQAVARSHRDQLGDLRAEVVSLTDRVLALEERLTQIDPS